MCDRVRGRDGGRESHCHPGSNHAQHEDVLWCEPSIVMEFSGIPHVGISIHPEAELGPR